MVDYPLMNQMLYMGMAAEVKRMTEDALAESVPVHELLANGLIAGFAVVGEDFKNSVLYVPEVLCATRALKIATAALKPALGEAELPRTGTLLIGTVEGDLHDIGKNLIIMMAEGRGFKVFDLGMDTPAEQFVAAAAECRPDVVAISALLTTTMGKIKEVIDAFRARPELGHIKLACGGAPVTQNFADEVGADGYAPDAASAVELFVSLMEKDEQNRGLD